jgi:hypothetical protein
MNHLNVFTFTPIGSYVTYKAVEAAVMSSSTQCSSTQQMVIFALLGIFGFLSFILCFIDWKPTPTAQSRLRFNSKILGSAFLSFFSFCSLTLSMYPAAYCLYPKDVLSPIVPLGAVLIYHYVSSQIAIFAGIPPDPISLPDPPKTPGKDKGKGKA